MEGLIEPGHGGGEGSSASNGLVVRRGDDANPAACRGDDADRAARNSAADDGLDFGKMGPCLF